MMGDKPKVSVCVMTYNQGAFIRHCLQSIFDQKTNFDFEVIVGDDCSTDGTREIVQEFGERYAGIIKTILHEKNVGPMKNFLSVHSVAQGEYIAHLDGDDYALPGKLQAQVNVLDNEPDCNVVWHRMKIQNERDGGLSDDINHNHIVGSMKFWRADLLRLGSITYHSSKMYRAKYRNLDQLVHPCLDYYISIINMDAGYGRILDGMYGVYRLSPGTLTGQESTGQLYLQHLRDFLTKYPEYKLEIAENALMDALANGKRLRKRALDGFVIFLKVFSLKPVLSLVKGWRVRRSFRFPKSL